jgi:hypothetical protein
MREWHIASSRCLFFVTAGLDPVVHAEPPRAFGIGICAFHRRMDCRIESGNDPKK